MTDKELRRLSRRELLQMLLEQTSEVERLQAELDKISHRQEEAMLEWEELSEQV